MSKLHVSIIIPTYNRWDLLQDCLRSVIESASASALKAEIIIADDCSTDQTSEAWRGLKSEHWPLRYHRNETNLRYLRNCNAAAKLARGKYICFLNNDVLVTEGWLDQLVQTLESTPDAGIVGPLFLDGKGRVLECGALVHSDGSARQLGRGADPNDRRFQFVNDVDYVSGACLLMETKLFWELGAHDELYIPCYYEDTDLCMQAAARGRRVLVDPRVRITHFEGSSNGTDVSSGLKRYQEVNKKKFLARWQQRLKERHPDAELPTERVLTWRRKGSIAVHYPRPVEFDKDSGALRTFLILCELRRRGYHVVVVAPSDNPRYSRELHGAGIETVIAGWGGDASCSRMVEEREPLAAIFTHIETLENFGKLYEARSPSTIRIWDSVDLAFLRKARERAVEAGQSADVKLNATNLPREANSELACMVKADITLVVSEVERQLLVKDLPFDASRVRVVSNIHEPEATTRPLAERSGFIFLGGFRHPPNVDAVLWMVESIWPLIRKKLPSAVLYLAGSHMPPKLKALASEAQGIQCLGFVEDHRATLAGARVMLAPLRYGAGVKGKIGEALAVGTPVVTTAIGAEGMDAEGTVLAVSDKPARFAELAVTLHENKSQWTQRSKKGRELLLRKFSTAANVDELLKSIEDAHSLRTTPSLWNLFAGMLWEAHGYPGEAIQYNQAVNDLMNRLAAQTSLIEEYKRTIATLRERESRMLQELAHSAVARQALWHRLEGSNAQAESAQARIRSR